MLDKGQCREGLEPHWRLCGGILSETERTYTLETSRGETACAPVFSVVVFFL